jgi:hypothetical protein
VSGAGTFTVNDGTANFSTGQAVTLSALRLYGGTLAGSDSVTVSGLFSWTAGTMQGAGTTALAMGASGTILGTDFKSLGRTLANAGTLYYTGTNFLFGPASGAVGVISNTGTFDAVGGGAFGIIVSGAHAFNNTGTFNRSGPGSTTTFSGVAFNNSGTVNVTEGTLSLNSGGTSSGAFSVSTGATLSLPASAYTLNAGASVSGGGILLLGGATLTAAADLSIPNLTFSGGTLNGSGNVTVTGQFSWSGGTLTGAGSLTLAAGSTSTISGPNSKTVDTATLNLAGTTNWDGVGNIILVNGGSLVNQATGIFNASGTIMGDLTNAGTLSPGGDGVVGVLTITGSYTQTATGNLHIDIGGPNSGTDYDQLLIMGNASLAGALNVSMINGYTLPDVGTQFMVMTFASSSGAFTINVTNLDPSLQLTPCYDATDLTLTANPAGPRLPSGPGQIGKRETASAIGAALLYARSADLSAWPRSSTGVFRNR